jgi:hypothetical protein
VNLLLAFLLVVLVGAMREARRERPARWLPMLALCAFMAVTFYGVYRVI